ncbi:two component transcriptional regulator, LuxR family [Propionibacteriaceae bacterium ES.041]|uniref:response regulator n=1 Tax=Enemella evansiae TaxID=2016499 RepID=UPI000B966630|nr:response regulator transcription factor [Enemella evansiae]OYO01089.1 DNA-binding response regulator [Enemella evansiae]PFG68158.1 two component transcriptional regulator, LuxR family [Propionibacteriaceae bacterium ES.041]
MTVRVLLVDDQEMIRMGLRMVLDSQPDLAIVGEADDGDTALELLDTVGTDVVLMDVRMPRMSGVEATRRLNERDNPPKVLILTTFDLDEYAYDALQAGASGFLLKDTPVEDITAAIKHLHAGDAVVAPSTTRRLLDHFTRSRPVGRDQTARLAGLTPREHEVLGLVARGLSNAEIAAELVLAEGTVKVHVGRILTKLHLRDRVQAVVLAYETGLVDARRR